jgi:hypothetical protein
MYVESGTWHCRLVGKARDELLEQLAPSSHSSSTEPTEQTGGESVSRSSLTEALIKQSSDWVALVTRITYGALSAPVKFAQVGSDENGGETPAVSCVTGCAIAQVFNDCTFARGQLVAAMRSLGVQVRVLAFPLRCQLCGGRDRCACAVLNR